MERGVEAKHVMAQFDEGVIAGISTAAIKSIAERYGGRKVRIFGSFARGENRDGSDLDLLIDLEPGRSLFDLVAIKQDLEDLLGIPVDVVTERSISPYIRDAVLQEAVSI